jgi:Pyruvate/2-oxoacid:ferredoxin oxidoreductase delta subunit
LDKDDIVLESYDNSSRQIPQPTKKVDEKSFRCDDKLLTEEQVKIETARCLGCGATIVDKNRCIGCGVCTTKCEFDAIHIHREHPECSKMIPSEDKLKAIIPNMIKREIKIRKASKGSK